MATKKKSDAPIAVFREEDVPKTMAEVEAIVLAEFAYWRELADSAGIGIGSACACGNIFAALKGCRAPWHPKGGQS